MDEMNRQIIRNGFVDAKTVRKKKKRKVYAQDYIPFKTNEMR